MAIAWWLFVAGVSSLSMTSRTTNAQLRRAAGSQSLDTLKEALVGWTVDEIDRMPSEDGKNALHMAAWQGSLDNLRYLLDLGCDIDRMAEGEFCYGKTAVFFAATRCRDEHILLLLERGAAVRIVNNKGQSVLSISPSHLQRLTTERIIEAEQAQSDRPWQNYRATHSDGLEYGDLDPRFLDRPLRETDVVTKLAINPTTKESRRGAFLRRNPHHAKENAKPRQPKKQRAKPDRVMTDEEKKQLESCWRALRNGSIDGRILREMVRVYEKRKRPWIADVATELAQTLNEPELDDLFAAALDNLPVARHVHLIERLRAQSSAPSQQPSKTQPRRNHRPSVDIDEELWREAHALVKGLNIAVLEPKNSSKLSLPSLSTFVDTQEGLDSVAHELSSHRLVSFDTEWALVDGRSVAATIQLAIGTRAWVIHLLVGAGEYQSECQDFVIHLFGTKLMLGFALGRDLIKLREWLGSSELSTDSCLDLQVLWAGKEPPGLAACAREVSRLSLSKVEQCSDWKHRPLTASQLAYAGLDAVVLPYILAETTRTRGPPLDD